MPSTTRTTYCRICESLCGLEVDVEGERVVAVRPDKQHPVSRGFACVKGIGLGALHHDPDRLGYPLKRVGSGFERVSWAEALTDIGKSLARLRRTHGPASVGLYAGNPTAFNFKSYFFADDFVKALGTPHFFASHSIDCNNKFDVAQRMYGLPTVHPVVDLENVQFLMVLGGNPAASQMSFVNVPNVVAKLKHITKRGGRLVVVDPRRTETAKLGEHVSIRPGADAHLLLAMLQVVLEEGRVDRASLGRTMRGLDALTRAVSEFTPEVAASVTGIPAPQIRALARAYAEADGAALYMSTGVNMGPFGSVCYWILQCLNLVTGNVDRRGGLLQPKGPFDLLKLTAALGIGTHGRTTRDGRFHGVVDALPAGALASAILTPGPDALRGLIVTSGNPVHSIPGGQLAKAFDALELLVCIDIYPSETSRYAHYILPATDMLERSDFPLTTALTQETPFAQFTERVVSPAFERREEWEIFCDLAHHARLPLVPFTLSRGVGALNRLLARFGVAGRITPVHLLALLLRAGDVSLGELERAPHGVLLPKTAPGSLLGKRVYTSDGLVDLAPPALVRDLARVRAFASEPVAGERLVMIGRREKRSHNSWMHNHVGLTQPPAPTALLHPRDAERRGVGRDDEVLLSGNGHSFAVPVEITEDVREGVVVVPHGWGHRESGLSRAAKLGGGNVNLLIPGGEAQLEPVSGQAIMTGHAIEVQKAPAR